MKQDQIPEAVYLYDVQNVTEIFFFLDNLWCENVVDTQVLLFKHHERLQDM